MARMTVKLPTKTIKTLDRLEKDAEHILKRGLYDGAAAMLSAVQSEIAAIPTGEGGWPEWVKDDLLTVGISGMENKGGKIDVKIGWDGYGGNPTPAHPQGVPIVLTARMVKAGTSGHSPNNFVARAKSRASGQAKAAAVATIEKEIQKITK